MTEVPKLRPLDPTSLPVNIEKDISKLIGKEALLMEAETITYRLAHAAEAQPSRQVEIPRTPASA